MTFVRGHRTKEGSYLEPSIDDSQLHLDEVRKNRQRTQVLYQHNIRLMNLGV